MYTSRLLRLCLWLLAIAALIGFRAEPAHADQSTEVWSMAFTYGRTVAKTDTATNTMTIYGQGIADPFPNSDQGGSDWTTLALTCDGTLYLMRRNAFSNTVGDADNVRLYSLPSNNIQIDPITNLITNVKFLGILSYNTAHIHGNVDGLTAGPDGNLYFTAYDVDNAPVRNGLFRIRPSALDPNPTPTSHAPIEFVGTFANNQGPGLANSFFTDLAFDPLTGDLVGEGISPNGVAGIPNHVTLYRLSAISVLGNVQNATFPWTYFAPNWANTDLSAYWTNPDGVAFTPNGDLFLSGDGQANPLNNGIVHFDRTAATPLPPGPLPGTQQNNLGYDLAIMPQCGSITVQAFCTDGTTPTPLPGVLVTITGPTNPSGNIVTGPDGTVTVYGLLPGQYTVTAPQTTGGLGLLGSTTQTVTVTTTNTVVTYNYTGVKITGNLFQDTNSNCTYQSGTDIDLSGITVTLTNTDTNQTYTTTTDAHGFYSFSGCLPAGNYTVSVPATVLKNGVTLTASTTSQSANLPAGGSVKLDFCYTAPPTGNGATRTWGFYKTHLDLFTSVVNQGCINLGVLTCTTGGGTEDLTHPSLGTLEGIFWTAPGQSTTPLGAARLALAHQLIAAEANVCYLGTQTQSKGFSATLIADAVAALDGTDIALINTLAGQLDQFNNSGDTISLPNGISEGSANPNKAKSFATDPGCAFK